MAKGPTPKSDALRAMREARYAAMTSNTRPKPAPAPTQEDVDAAATKPRKPRKNKEQ